MRSPFSVRQLVMQWSVFSLVFIAASLVCGEQENLELKNLNVSLASMFCCAFCRLAQYGKYMFLFVSVVLCCISSTEMEEIQMCVAPGIQDRFPHGDSKLYHIVVFCETYCTLSHRTIQQL